MNLAIFFYAMITYLSMYYICSEYNVNLYSFVELMHNSVQHCAYPLARLRTTWSTASKANVLLLPALMIYTGREFSIRQGKLYTSASKDLPNNFCVFFWGGRGAHRRAGAILKALLRV